VFWDDSDNKLTYLTAGSGLTITGTTIAASGGIGGSTGSVDNAILRADGTGGATLQTSGLVAEDAIVSFTSITGDALTDVITATGSAFTDGQPVRFTALTGGSGLNTTTNYFVREVSGATFKVETSIGGGAINFTTNITAGTLLTGHSVSTNVTLSENTTATNSDLVLTPKGTGALIAGPKPDGTTTGGNARGTNAVDLQLSRTAATQVAAGVNSVICGGLGNSAISVYNFVGGGVANSVNSADSGCIVGGNSNSVTVRLGAICGGTSNSITTSNESFIGGGRSNSATGVGSVIGGGGIFSGSSIGNTTSATSSAILGGWGGLADRYGMQAHAAGRFAANGDAQRARFVMRCKTTTNTGVEMALDGSTTYLTIPSGKVIFMNIKVVGTKSDGSAVATYERQYAVKNVAGTSTEVYAPITIGTDNAAGTTIEVATVDQAGAATDYVRIRPTGIASETWRWVASVDAVEVAYGT
jgi:hypothetical protein